MTQAGNQGVAQQHPSPNTAFVICHLLQEWLKVETNRMKISNEVSRSVGVKGDFSGACRQSPVFNHERRSGESLMFAGLWIKNGLFSFLPAAAEYCP